MSDKATASLPKTLERNLGQKASAQICGALKKAGYPSRFVGDVIFLPAHKILAKMPGLSEENRMALYRLSHRAILPPIALYSAVWDAEKPLLKNGQVRKAFYAGNTDCIWRMPQEHQRQIDPSDYKAAQAAVEIVRVALDEFRKAAGLDMSDIAPSVTSDFHKSVWQLAETTRMRVRVLVAANKIT